MSCTITLMELRVEIPHKIANVLATDKRYKVLYGGRASAKSWSVARYLVALGTAMPLRIMCARELQKSLTESVHQLLSDQIDNLELHAYYEVQKSKIIGKEGTTAFGTSFLFSGIKNAHNIKSFEGVDICWVEEAQVVSEESWKILIPTVRRKNSQIWVTFNPEFDDDDTYVRFVLKPSDDTAITMVNYDDNPWCPEVILAEAAKLKKENIVQYDHVYGGQCITALEGAVYNMTDFNKYKRLPEKPDMIVISADTAYKADQHNDPSVFEVWYVTKSAYYLAEVHRGRWLYPEMKRRMYALADDINPTYIIIEDKASGQSLIQEMREETRHNIMPINPVGDKLTRAIVAAAPVEAGKVWLPEEAEWLHEFRREIMLFPPPVGSKVCDDQVDAMTQFLSFMQDKKPSNYAQTMAELYGVTLDD